MPTLVGYISIQTESQSVQGVNSYDICLLVCQMCGKGTFSQIRSQIMYKLKSNYASYRYHSSFVLGSKKIAPAK